jgi:hypothetical protein
MKKTIIILIFCSAIVRLETVHASESIYLSNTSWIKYYSGFERYNLDTISKKEINTCTFNDTFEGLLSIGKSDSSTGNSSVCIGLKSDLEYNQLFYNKIALDGIVGLFNQSIWYIYGGVGVVAYKDNILKGNNNFNEDLFIKLKYFDYISFSLETQGLIADSNEARSLRYGIYYVNLDLRLSYPEIIPAFFKTTVLYYQSNTKSPIDPLIDYQGNYTITKIHIGYSLKNIDLSCGFAYLSEGLYWQKYKTSDDFSSKENSGTVSKSSFFGGGIDFLLSQAFTRVDIFGDFQLLMNKKDSSDRISMSKLGIKYVFN